MRLRTANKRRKQRQKREQARNRREAQRQREAVRQLERQLRRVSDRANSACRFVRAFSAAALKVGSSLVVALLEANRGNRVLSNPALAELSAKAKKATEKAAELRREQMKRATELCRKHQNSGTMLT